jgi:hypothetical protein
MVGTARDFELFVSQAVITEASRGDSSAAARRLAALDEVARAVGHTAGAGRVETLELGHRYGHLSPLVAVA